MQLRLPWDVAPSKARGPRIVTAGGREFPVAVVRHRWARRYLIRVTESGAVRLTVPRSGTIAGGLDFASRQQAWIAAEWRRLAARAAWRDGTLIWFRGERSPLAVAPPVVCVADLTIRVIGDGTSGAVRAAVQRAMRAIAERDLPRRCRELAAVHGLAPARVSVRDQRSRWGACSARQSITLNWRLVQMPPSVADYVILHELAHLRQPNHSRRFWREVAGLCPAWRESERWLRRHGRELI